MERTSDLVFWILAGPGLLLGGGWGMEPATSRSGKAGTTAHAGLVVGMRMRIGIIGTNWGRMHIGAFRAAGAEVVALCGLDAGRARSVATEERIPLATTDVAELIAASEAVV